MKLRSEKSRGQFETTRRLLAQLVNERLASATVEDSKLCLRCKDKAPAATDRWVAVDTQPYPYHTNKKGHIISMVRPENMMPVVRLGNETSQWDELDPGAIFTFVAAWFAEKADATLIMQMAEELRNSAEFQEKWLDISNPGQLLSLKSPSIAWEQSVVFGHPTHPFHRLCYAQPPLDPIATADLPNLLLPSLALISIPRVDVRVTGPFEDTIRPLLRNWGFQEPSSSDRIIVPCLARQIPSILSHFPNATFLQSINACADAQSNIRTIAVRPDIDFVYLLKLSLAVQITSALRTITPWTACGGPHITEILDKLAPVLPPSLWIFREVAAVVGGQMDFNEARHLACILREDLHPRAKENNEVLIVASALIQQLPHDTRTYPEILFHLDTMEDKLNWFRSYIECLFKSVLPPVMHHGIALEAHPQNTVVRVCINSGQIKGFSIRDFGGVRMHKPTLRRQEFDTEWELPGGSMLSDDIHYVWDIISHALLQNHVVNLLVSLGLERSGGWSMVREELAAALKSGDPGSVGEQLHDYLMKPTLKFKCFLRMRMQGVYRYNMEEVLPNVLLT